MIFAADCQYFDNSAVCAGILFNHWDSPTACDSLVKTVKQIEPYIPGEFYKRELPCIMALIEALPQLPDIIVVDGYVALGKQQKPGLGMHLYHALKQQVPIIGVAKKEFIDTPSEAKIFRGKSQNPLYISSVGIELAAAKSAILAMHGKFRNPTLLKYVDQLARGIKSCDKH